MKAATIVCIAAGGYIFYRLLNGESNPVPGGGGGGGGTKDFPGPQDRPPLSPGSQYAKRDPTLGVTAESRGSSGSPEPGATTSPAVGGSNDPVTKPKVPPKVPHANVPAYKGSSNFRDYDVFDLGGSGSEGDNGLPGNHGPGDGPGQSPPGRPPLLREL